MTLSPVCEPKKAIPPSMLTEVTFGEEISRRHKPSRMRHFLPICTYNRYTTKCSRLEPFSSLLLGFGQVPRQERPDVRVDHLGFGVAEPSMVAAGDGHQFIGNA